MYSKLVRIFFLVFTTAGVVWLCSCPQYVNATDGGISPQTQNAGKIDVPQASRYTASENIALQPPVSANTVTIMDELSSLTLDKEDNSYDSAKLIQYGADGSGYTCGVEIVVTLENGLTTTKEFNQICRNPYLLYADLMCDDTDEFVLALPNPISNFDATDVHILKVIDGRLEEILTILCTPEQSQVDEYMQTLLTIPNPPDNFGLQEHNIYTTFCTGVAITIFNGREALKIRHLAGEITPYSIIYYNGTKWDIGNQGTV